MSLTLLLTACSNGGYDPNGDVTIGWQDGVIMYNGKPTGLTEYIGYQAKVTAGNGGIDYDFTLDTDTATVTNITPNTQGIEEANMNKYKGKYWYTEYLNTKFTMADQVADKTFMVCQTYVNSLTPELVASYASEYMDSFKLTNGNVYVDFGLFTFGSGFDIVKVTTTGASVTGTAKVSKESKGCDTPYTYTSPDGKQVINMMSKSTEKYNYYEYDGYTIQLASGLDLGTYIKFD